MASSGARRLSRIFSTNPRAQSQTPAPSPAPPPKAPTDGGEQADPKFKSARRRKAFNRSLGEIIKERDPEEFARKFIAASKTWDTRFRNLKDVYEKAVSRLASSGHRDAAVAVIEAQKPFLDAETEGFAARLLHLYVRASMPSHSAAFFRDLPPQHKSVNTFNALLSACVHFREFEALASAFQEIPDSCPTVVPNMYSYNILISGLCKKPDFSAALDVIALMEKQGLSPDIISFNTLLNGFYNSICPLDDADKVWEMMKERNVEPDTKSYNAKLWGLVARSRIDDAVALIEAMEKDGPRPDTKSYDALIRGYWKQGRLDDAVKVFDDLVEMNGKDGLKPDTLSYNELIRGYCRGGRLDDAIKVYNDLLKSECVPNGGTFGTLVLCLVEAGELDRALNCCHEIFSRKCRVNGSLIQGVITALVAASRMEEATRIVKLGRANNYPRKFLAYGENSVVDETDQGDSA